MAKARILVVEDENIVAQDIQLTLTQLGYEVPTPVASGEAVLACLEKIHPDLVLMDIHLAGKIDGITAAEHIRQQSGVPIVYLTAHSDEATFRRANITEPYGYVLKPFEERELAIAIDIALYRHEAERKLRKMEQWLTSTLKSMGDAVIAADLEGKVTFMNQIAETLTGWNNGEALGHRFDEVLRLVDDLSRAPVPDLIRRVIHEEMVIEIGHSLLIMQNGSERPVDDSAAPIRNSAGEIIGVVVVFRDVAARKQVEEQLHHAATHDTLTGLPNRALLLDRLARIFEYSRRHPEHKYALLLLDLDRFKVINDSLGHLFGDQVLTNVARRLEREVRFPDTVARFGGDEFVILLDGITHVRDALLVAERIHKSLEIPINLGARDLFTAASIGIALSDADNAQPEDVLHNADVALYRAKAAGKGCTVVFDAALNEHAAASLRLEKELRRGVGREEFVFYYQPIISLADQHICGLEALLRWQHPQRGLLLPGEFLKLAEETGFLNEIGEWLLLKACQQVLTWKRFCNGHQPVMVSVNMSRRQFTHPDFVERVSRVLSETGIDPHCLCLDVTEGVFSDPEVTNRTLPRLRQLGVRIHVDDFGTGYFSLNTLHRAPVDILKIDRVFVQRLNGERGEQEASLVRAILLLARELNLEVIAEGIETARQAAYLKTLSCQYGQGNWFSEPLDAEGITALLEKKPAS